MDPDEASARLRTDRRETEQRLSGLTETFTDIIDASESSNADDEHDPEGATIAFERSQVAALVRQAQEHLAELDAAEARVRGGTYGICESCGHPVAAARLDARPTARTCIRCAAGPPRAVRRRRG